MKQNCTIILCFLQPERRQSYQLKENMIDIKSQKQPMKGKQIVVDQATSTQQ
jgi:hypothetical protein